MAVRRVHESPGNLPALWVTERRGRLSRRAINEAFEEARNAAGLDPVLDLHCLRHSYITHLIEFGYPERFAQDQAGHSYCEHDRDLYGCVGRVPEPLS